MELAVAQLISTIVAATTAVAGTALTVQQGIERNRQVKASQRAASEKAAMEQVAQNAAARQQRSVAARRIALQVDAARVLGGASGVSGGASALVLESAYSRDARTDLSQIDSNLARGQLSIQSGLNARLTALQGERANPLATALTGIIQGANTYATMSDNLTGVLTAQPSTPPAERIIDAQPIQPSGPGLYATPLSGTPQQAIT